jgi:hypothetical protein
MAAQPIASRRPKGAIEAAGASWTIGSQEDGWPLWDARSLPGL